MLPVGNHTIADRDAAHSSARIHYDADIAIAERQRLVQLIENGFDCRQNPIGSGLVEDHLHFVRLLACFFDQAGFAEFNEHALGTRRHKRTGRTDQHLAARERGTRNVGDLSDPSSKVLQNLLQIGSIRITSQPEST